MTDDFFYANWAMPFGEKAKIELVNDGKKARDVELTIVHEPLDRFEGLGHFHCKWHRDAHTLPEDRWPDWTMVETEGRGRFMGVMLHVWNPRGGWWGEGDEKFFVDGEKYPSTFGTGSEDYFGYAWCHPGLFQRPFHSQTMTMGNRGHHRFFAGSWRTTFPSRSPLKAASRNTIAPKRRAHSTPARSAGTWPLAESIPTIPFPSTSATTTT